MNASVPLSTMQLLLESVVVIIQFTVEILAALFPCDIRVQNLILN